MECKLLAKHLEFKGFLLHLSEGHQFWIWNLGIDDIGIKSIKSHELEFISDWVSQHVRWWSHVEVDELVSSNDSCEKGKEFHF